MLIKLLAPTWTSTRKHKKVNTSLVTLGMCRWLWLAATVIFFWIRISVVGYQRRSPVPINKILHNTALTVRKLVQQVIGYNSLLLLPQQIVQY